MQQTNEQATPDSVAMTPKYTREVVKFTPNIPVEVALKYACIGPDGMDRWIGVSKSH